MSVLSSRIPPNLSIPEEQRSKRAQVFKLLIPACEGEIAERGGGRRGGKAMVLGLQHYDAFCRAFSHVYNLEKALPKGQIGKSHQSPLMALETDKVTIRLRNVQLLNEQLQECITHIQCLDLEHSVLPSATVYGGPSTTIATDADEGEDSTEERSEQSINLEDFVDIESEMDEQECCHEYSSLIPPGSPLLSSEASLSPTNDLSCSSPFIPDYYHLPLLGSAFNNSGRNARGAALQEPSHRRKISQKLYRFVGRVSGGASTLSSPMMKQPKSPSELFRNSLAEATHAAGITKR